MARRLMRRAAPAARCAPRVEHPMIKRLAHEVEAAVAREEVAAGKAVVYLALHSEARERE